jgi:hypothetical protein
MARVMPPPAIIAMPLLSLPQNKLFFIVQMPITCLLELKHKLREFLEVKLIHILD